MPIIETFIVPHPPLIIPEVGKGNEKSVEETIKSYNTISEQISKIKPDTIVISSPHAPYYNDGFYLSDGEYLDGNLKKFNAPTISFHEKIDNELVNQIDEIAKKIDFPIAKTKNIELDHGTMVPLYFIRKRLKNYKIIVLGLSNLPFLTHYKMGEIIQEAVNKIDKKVVYVASGDLSHKLQSNGPYGFVPEGPIYDNILIEDCKKGDFINLFDYSKDLINKASPCGHLSFIMMAGAIDGYNVMSKFYSYQDITGVGYGILEYKPIEKNEKRFLKEEYMKNKNRKEIKDPYINLAQKAITNYILCHEIIDYNKVQEPELLNNQAGVFVSIHKFGRLRGCIGTFLPTTDCIAKEIIQNAISASCNDYRFHPITEEELNDLEISVDVLSEPGTINSIEELDPKKYGIIVSSNNKRGLLLPDLEGVDNIDTQISIAKRKGNIGENEEIKIQRFTVNRHKEEKR